MRNPKYRLIVLQDAVMRDYRLKLFEAINRSYEALFIFPTTPVIQLPQHFKNIVLNGSSAFMRYILTTKHLLMLNYDIVLVPAESRHSLIAWVITRIRRKKIVLWGEIWYDLSIDISIKTSPNQFPVLLKKAIKRKMVKMAFSSADSIIAIGQKPYERYLKYVDKGKVFCSPKYVESPGIKDCKALLEHLGGKGKKRIILFSGRLIRVKGLEYLIEAFSKLESEFEDSFLLIIGEGELRENLEELTGTLNAKSVKFHGWLTRQELSYFYKECYVFVQPSIFTGSRGEANGYSIYECMAYSKPIVTTDAVGAAPQFVQNGVNGFVVRNADAEALRFALRKLLLDEALAKEMGRKSKEIYDREINLSGQINTFNNAIIYALRKMD